MRPHGAPDYEALKRAGGISRYDSTTRSHSEFTSRWKGVGSITQYYDPIRDHAALALESTVLPIPPRLSIFADPAATVWHSPHGPANSKSAH